MPPAPLAGGEDKVFWSGKVHYVPRDGAGAR
jgi:hypothetical protein